MKFFTFLFTLFISISAISIEDLDEKLWVIAQVSDTGRSFVIRRGGKDNITLGQEGFFSNSDVKFRARATEVSRYVSLWKITEENSKTPFKKGDLVNYSHATEDINTSIVSVNISPQKKESPLKETFWKFKIGASLTLAEVQSNQENSDRSRKGLSLEGYRAHLLSPNWNFAYGLRLDRDSYNDTEFETSATTSRYLAVTELNYLLDQFSSQGNYYYAGIGLGYGLSSSEVQGATATGTTLLLPAVKIGYQGVWKKNTKWIVEGVIESLSQNESYVDSDSQSTQIINTKINLGLMF